MRATMDLEDHWVAFFRIETGWFHNPAFDFKTVVRRGPCHTLDAGHLSLTHEVAVEIREHSGAFARLQ